MGFVRYSSSVGVLKWIIQNLSKCGSYLKFSSLLADAVKTLPLFDYLRTYWGLIWDGSRSPRERAISLVDRWVQVLPRVHGE
jgi:hypothetical protein